MKKRRQRKDAGARAVRSDSAPAPVTPLEWPLLERQRPFWGISLVLLGVMTSLMIYSARLETATMDEPVYPAAGYRYLKTGEFSFNAEHPPLAKFLAALPLLPLNPRLPTETDLYRNLDLRMGQLFLYRNRVPPERLLFRARLPFILLTAAFGLLLAAWTRRNIGALPALVALVLYSLDPNIIAHGRYAATDMIAVVFFFLSCVAWARFLRTRSYVDLLLAGMALGLAFSAKFSNLCLIGILPLLYLIRWWQAPGRFSVRHFVGSVMIVVLLGGAVVGLLYGPETVRAVTGDQMPMLENVVNPGQPSGKLLHWLGQTFHLRAHPYLVGLYQMLQHDERGHRAYLMGELSNGGRWSYFPVAFAVKTPVALLLGLVFAGVVGVYSFLSGDWGQIRRSPFFWLLLTVPPAVFFLIAMKANINIGLRHILLIYPFLFVLVAVVLVRRRAVTLMLVLAALLVFEHARVAPHYLAFFNSLIGGPNHGAEYLVDSNLDWGQDLKKLKTYVESNQIENLCLAYFGPSDFGYYELAGDPVPTQVEYRQKEGPGCVAAVSASRLMGIAGGQARTYWLRDLEPMDRVGYSIFIYDLRRRGSRGGSDGSRGTRPL